MPRSQCWKRSRSWSSCGGYFRAKVDDSGDGKPTQSFSSERQCACKASFGDGFGEDKLPVLFVSVFHLAGEIVYPYLILTPSSASTGGCLLPVLLNAILVPTRGINTSVGRGGHMGGVHLVHW